MIQKIRVVSTNAICTTIATHIKLVKTEIVLIPVWTPLNVADQVRYVKAEIMLQGAIALEVSLEMLTNIAQATDSFEIE